MQNAYGHTFVSSSRTRSKHVRSGTHVSRLAFLVARARSKFETSNNVDGFPQVARCTFRHDVVFAFRKVLCQVHTVGKVLHQESTDTAVIE